MVGPAESAIYRACAAPEGAARDPMTSAQLMTSLPFIPAALWPSTGQ